MRRLLVLALLLAACTKHEPPAPAHPPASILFITLDTTRADAITPENTPALDGLMKRALVFRYAYTAVPQTLPSHITMLSGVYPAAHRVHENGRTLTKNATLISEKLHDAGYHTAAFISAFALAKRFGTARGFEVYDEDFGADRAERTAGETTDRALAWLGQHSAAPLFLWVHYYDPHYPYTPPEPFASRFAKQPYYGEVAYMDQQLGRLVAAFEQQIHGPRAILIAGDHGEGLGEHGEAQHGNLLYQSTMHVPLMLIADDTKPAVVDTPVSTRRIYATLRDLAGLDPTNTLRNKHEPIVMGEAMKPFLDYGWQPQVMAVEKRRKTIMAGSIEVYDVIADPAEKNNLASTTNLSRHVRAALRDYPVPSVKEAAASNLTDEERKQLAALGYVSSTVKPVVRKDAPRPADMAPLFPLLDKASGLFVRERYAEVVPLLEEILKKDPYNLDAALHLATAHSAMGHDQQALDAFTRAQQIAPDSPDVRTYLALHYARGKDWERAVPMLEQILGVTPDKVPAIEALAVLRVKQGRLQDALALRQRLYALRAPSQAELASLGELAMQIGATDAAISAFSKVPGRDLELGVLYLSDGRYEDARAALDRVPPSHPEYPMALFKRAQVSVLLNEPDAPQKIALARQHANAVTGPLIERERLFASYR